MIKVVMQGRYFTVWVEMKEPLMRPSVPPAKHFDAWPDNSWIILFPDLDLGTHMCLCEYSFTTRRHTACHAQCVWAEMSDCALSWWRQFASKLDNILPDFFWQIYTIYDSIIMLITPAMGSLSAQYFRCLTSGSQLAQTNLCLCL